MMGARRSVEAVKTHPHIAQAVVIILTILASAVSSSDRLQSIETKLVAINTRLAVIDARSDIQKEDLQRLELQVAEIRNNPRSVTQ